MKVGSEDSLNARTVRNRVARDIFTLLRTGVDQFNYFPSSVAELGIYLNPCFL